jgi:hypothetical protein
MGSLHYFGPTEGRIRTTTANISPRRAWSSQIRSPITGTPERGCRGAGRKELELGGTECWVTQGGIGCLYVTIFPVWSQGFEDRIEMLNCLSIHLLPPGYIILCLVLLCIPPNTSWTLGKGHITVSCKSLSCTGAIWTGIVVLVILGPIK